ncbi:ribose 5-phosphate isomerase B [Thermodesulfobacteriota bacterium]
MKISIASDHAGYAYKSEIIRHVENRGISVIDFGTDSDDSVDYPDFIKPAALSVAKGESDLGIVLGGSGNGEAIAANKIQRIRCAVCWSIESARLAKEHNNANMISIGQRIVTLETALEIVDSWLKASFEGGRHIQRIEKIEGVGGD